MSNQSIVFTNMMAKHYIIEHVIISPINKEKGVVVVSSTEEEQEALILRIFAIEFDHEADSYVTTSELEAFSFDDQEFGKKFIDHLPNMSAIELMFAMNNFHKKHILQ
ncbi:hypothetical protein [Pontibacillus salipaludis]|uniref:hypothetical protein n=1 Tax=Pontibacillus salipaludis TaxID=1697394 RepID=UPI0031F0FB95